MTGFHVVLFPLSQLKLWVEGWVWEQQEGGSWGWRDKSAAVGQGACGCSYCRFRAIACTVQPSPPRFCLGKSTLRALATSPGAPS